MTIPLDHTLGGSLPVVDDSDVLKEFPRPHRNNDTAPIRDAFVRAFAESFLEYQDDAENTSAQLDPLRATGEYLRSIAAERQVFPVSGESEEHLRSRLFSAPSIVTPGAIQSAVNDILDRYTTKRCQVCEPLMDAAFLSDGIADAYDGGFFLDTPVYPDRLYPEDAALNDGFFIPDNMPGDFILESEVPRTFLIRVPVLQAADTLFAFVGEMFIGDGTDAFGTESDGTVACSVYGDGLTETQIYDAVVGTVEVIKGQGMSWILWVDSSL